MRTDCWKRIIYKSYTSTDRKKVMHATITMRSIIHKMWTGSEDGLKCPFCIGDQEYIKVYAVHTEIGLLDNVTVYAMVEIKPLYAALYHMMVNIETGEMLPVLE